MRKMTIHREIIWEVSLFPLILMSHSSCHIPVGTKWKWKISYKEIPFAKQITAIAKAIGSFPM
jgi:hypothetical protein